MTEYFGIHTEGWLADRGKDDSLILDDGSVWQISPHRDKARSWVRVSNISVSEIPVSSASTATHS